MDSQSPYRAFEDPLTQPLINDLQGRSNKLGTGQSLPSRENTQEKQNIDDMRERELDSLLSGIYLVYSHQGFWPLIMKKLTNLLIYLFILFLTVFLTSFVSYSKLRNVTREIPLIDCFDFSIRNISPVIWIVTIPPLLLWILNLIQLIRDIPTLLKIKCLYSEDLKIPDVTIVEWNYVVNELRKNGLENTKFKNVLPTDFTLDLYIAARIMRKENYIIALFNQDIFGMSMLFKRSTRIPYIKSVEWILNHAVWNFIFENGSVRPMLLDPRYRSYYVAKLARHMRIYAFIFLILSPIAFFYLLIYYSCSYFDQIRSSPSMLGGRMWNRYALWKFRQLNELSHFFNERMDRSRQPTISYIDSFPQPLTTQLSRFLGFIIGALLILILILGCVSDDALVRLTILNHSLIYFAGIFGIILAYTSYFISQKPKQSDAQKYLDEISQHVRYRPKSWEIAASPEALNEILSLFSYRILIFLQGIFGIIIGPIWLGLYLPRHAESILNFIARSTIYDSRFGYICRFSVFDFSFNFSESALDIESQVTLEQRGLQINNNDNNINDNNRNNVDNIRNNNVDNRNDDIRNNNVDDRNDDIRNNNVDNRNNNIDNIVAPLGSSGVLTEKNKMEASMITFIHNHPQWVPPPNYKYMVHGLRDYMTTSSINRLEH